MAYIKQKREISMSNKRLIILTFIAAVSIMPLHPTISQELQKIAINNENFIALQKLHNESNRLTSASTIHKTISSGLSALGALTTYKVLRNFNKYYLSTTHDGITENKGKIIMTIALAIITASLFGGSYLIYELGQVHITHHAFKNKLKALFESWDDKAYSTHTFSKVLYPVMKTYQTTWVHLQNESEKKADTYLHGVSRALYKHVKKTSYWRSCIGKQTIAELIILASMCEIFRHNDLIEESLA